MLFNIKVVACSIYLYYLYLTNYNVENKLFGSTCKHIEKIREPVKVVEEPVYWVPREYAPVAWVEEPRPHYHQVTREYENKLPDAVFTYTDEHHT